MMEPIQGVSLEKYADLSALMSDTGGNLEKCAQIAEANGVTKADWAAAMDGWTKRMSDPANMGKVALAFMPLYQAAMDRKRAGKEPSSIEEYARITAEYSFRKDPSDPTKTIDFQAVLKENNLELSQWAEISGYWTLKVNNPTDPASTKFRELIQKESDRIYGIKR